MAQWYHFPRPQEKYLFIWATSNYLLLLTVHANCPTIRNTFRRGTLRFSRSVFRFSEQKNVVLRFSGLPSISIWFSAKILGVFRIWYLLWFSVFHIWFPVSLRSCKTLLIRKFFNGLFDPSTQLLFDKNA